MSPAISFRTLDDGNKFAAARGRIHGKYDVCPLCREKIIKPDAPLVLMVSNQCGLPNRVLHQACFDKLGASQAESTLWEDYRAAQEFAHWFDL